MNNERQIGYNPRYAIDDNELDAALNFFREIGFSLARNDYLFYVSSVNEQQKNPPSDGCLRWLSEPGGVPA